MNKMLHLSLMEFLEKLVAFSMERLRILVAFSSSLTKKEAGILGVMSGGRSWLFQKPIPYIYSTRMRGIFQLGLWIDKQKYNLMCIPDCAMVRRQLSSEQLPKS